MAGNDSLLNPLSGANIRKRIGAAFSGPFVPRSNEAASYEPLVQFVQLLAADQDKSNAGKTGIAGSGMDQLQESAHMNSWWKIFNIYRKVETGSLPTGLNYLAFLTIKLPRLATFLLDRTLYFPAQKLETNYRNLNNKRHKEFNSQLEALPSAILVLNDPLTNALNPITQLTPNIDEQMANFENEFDKQFIQAHPQQAQKLSTVLISDHTYRNMRIAFMKESKLLRDSNGKVIFKPFGFDQQVVELVKISIARGEIIEGQISPSKNQLQRTIANHVSGEMRQHSVIQEERRKEGAKDPKINFYTGLTGKQIGYAIGWFFYSAFAFIPRAILAPIAGTLTAMDEGLFRLPVRDKLLGTDKAPPDIVPAAANFVKPVPITERTADDLTVKIEESSLTRDGQIQSGAEAEEEIAQTLKKLEQEIISVMKQKQSSEMPTDTEIVGSTNTNINVGENGKAKDQKNSKTMEEVAKENKRLIISIRSMEEAIETLNQVNSPSITSSPTSSASEESTSSSTKASLKKSLPSSALSGVTKPTEQSEKKVNAFLEQGRKKKEAKQNAKEQSKFAKESAKDTNAMVKDYARTLSSKEQLELEIRTTIDPRVGMDKKTTEAAEYLLKESLATSKLTATTCWKKEAHSHDHHGLDFPKKANLESSKATEDDEGEGDGDGKNTRHSP